MNNKLKALVIPAMLTLSVILLVVASAPAQAAANKKQGTVSYGSYEQILVGTWTTSTDLHFTVTSNTTIDVYVLTAEDIINYPSGSFSPVKAVENTKSADFKIKSETTNSYYLIIDNTDNSRSSDALPKGDAAYNATYPNWMDTAGHTVDSIVSTCILGAIAVVVIIIVVIIVIVYFVVIRKKPQPPVVQAPYAAPAVQYQQPVYQPQPQPYAPAPPSVYEPPPPPQQQGYSQPPVPPGQQYPPV
jgi:heme/copper-type cytochrome/quinol oxidase subunit 2